METFAYCSERRQDKAKIGKKADDCMDAGVRATLEAKADFILINEHFEPVFNAVLPSVLVMHWSQ